MSTAAAPDDFPRTALASTSATIVSVPATGALTVAEPGSQFGVETCRPVAVDLECFARGADDPAGDDDGPCGKARPEASRGAEAEQAGRSPVDQGSGEGLRPRRRGAAANYPDVFAIAAASGPGLGREACDDPQPPPRRHNPKGEVFALPPRKRR